MLTSLNILALAAIAAVSAAPAQYFTDPTSDTGKAGLAYPKSSMCTKLFTNKHISWGYNWEGVRQGLPQNIKDFVPTCRGGKNSDLCNALTDYTGVTHMFSFNEPDKADQDMFDEPLGSYSLAVAMWMEKIQPHSGMIRLGAPSVSNSQAPGEGMDYLRGFLKACESCTIDFLNIHWHWYGGLTGQEYFQKFKEYIKGVHAEFPDREIWIGEFSAEQGSVNDIVEFLRLAMQWMNKQKYIARYAYYMAAPGDPSTGAMGTPDGTALNPIGQLYNSF